MSTQWIISLGTFEVKVLTAIFSSSTGVLNIGQLRTKLSVKPSKIQACLDQLRRKEFVSRRKDPEVSYYKYFLTPRGEAILALAT